MIKYGGKYYYNPALPEVQKHLLNIVNVVNTISMRYILMTILIKLLAKSLMTPLPMRNMVMGVLKIAPF
jgi:hypothetical protein